MKLEELIQLATNKKNSLIDKKNVAYMNGNIEEFYSLEEQINEIELILEKLST